MIYPRRLQILKNTLEKIGIDGFLVSNFYSIYYLSGFKTLTENEREAWMFTTKNNTYLFTDARYFNEQVRAERALPLHILLISPEKNLLQHLKEIIGVEKIQTLGFEAEDLKYNEYVKIVGVGPQTGEETSPLQFIPTNQLIIKQREIKEIEEIENIKEACRLTDKCLEEIIKTIKIGQTEQEIAFKIELFLKKRGYDLAFYPIIAFDQNSALPHYDTKLNGKAKIQNNSVVLIDFGVKYKGYLSDISRMVFIGNQSDEVRNIYEVIKKSQQEAIETISTGIASNAPTQNIDKIARSIIINSGLPNYQHSTGHGVGLEIHEYPKISHASTDVVQKNQVFTIEPGVYIPGKYGFRIEDTVAIESEKQVCLLTQFPKNILII